MKEENDPTERIRDRDLTIYFVGLFGGLVVSHGGILIDTLLDFKTGLPYVTTPIGLVMIASAGLWLVGRILRLIR